MQLQHCHCRSTPAADLRGEHRIATSHTAGPCMCIWSVRAAVCRSCVVCPLAPAPYTPQASLAAAAAADCPVLVTADCVPCTHCTATSHLHLSPPHTHTPLRPPPHLNAGRVQQLEQQLRSAQAAKQEAELQVCTCRVPLSWELCICSCLCFPTSPVVQLDSIRIQHRGLSASCSGAGA
jgi:hypothetical protein